MFIKLTNRSFFFEIDAEGFDKIKNYSWHYEPDNKSIRGTINGKKVFLHRFLLDFPEGHVDHKNRNRLDLTRNNLRVCPPHLNQLNKRKTSRPTTSQFKGVSALTNGKFRARISIGKLKLSLGIFKTEIEAAQAYDTRAKELHGEFACLNFN